ncbi:hypothetical protein NEHOM01_1971 [Nematocida homosporus]|uniref:uncharacterized protein n=1 Tax=Nematocida homosporus TaxID=1912981 RepID=UPI0022202BC1|nr:uncharacterized protein NEHOM01_1971 [Nematocida homosporus]KAI5187155.1 hypothetical protein NEHOM01_1971 [Nematocida homosporus]
MALEYIEVQIGEWEKFNNRHKSDMLDKIKTILKNSDGDLSINKVSLAYHYIARQINIRNIVAINGTTDEEAHRIKETVFGHELLSPRLSIAQFLERMVNNTLSPRAGIDILLDIIHASVSNRFTLYKNVYNLEIQTNRRQLYSYTRILEKVWEFHRNTKNALYQLACLEKLIEDNVPDKIPGNRLHTLEYMRNYMKNKDLYEEIKGLLHLIEKKRRRGEQFRKSDLILAKSISGHFVDLSYDSYYIYGYGPNDLLFLYYELFHAHNKRQFTAQKKRLNQCIYQHIKEIRRVRARIRKDRTITKQVKTSKLNRIEQLKFIFINRNFSFLSYKIVPWVNSFLGWFFVKVCVFYFADLALSLSDKPCMLDCQELEFKTKLVLAILLIFTSAIGSYVAILQQVGYTRGGVYGKIKERPIRVCFQFILLIGVGLLYYILPKSDDMTFTRMPVLGLLAVLALLCLVGADPWLRYEYVFSFTDNHKAFVTITYTLSLVTIGLITLLLRQA